MEKPWFPKEVMYKWFLQTILSEGKGSNISMLDLSQNQGVGCHSYAENG